MQFFIQHRFSTLRWTVVKFWRIFKMLLYTVVYCAKILFYLDVIYVLLTQVLSLRANLNLHTARLRRIS